MNNTTEENACENAGRVRMARRMRTGAQVLLLALALLFSGRAFALRAQASEEHTYNVLLVGSDRRDSSWNGNSDSVILVTVNYDTSQIYLTSFMRDLYADIPGYGAHKLNYSYAVGGASLLEQTLESNYGVKIDHYAAADFETMADLVDEMGGLDLELSDAEAEIANDYIKEMCGLRDLNPDDYYLSGGGSLHLDGIQTVAYARIRYVGNNDYERTARQRKVLTALRTKLQAMEQADLETFVLKAIAQTDNDIALTDTMDVLKVVADSRMWEQVENRVPYDGMFSSQSEMLVPDDMSATVSKLTGLIYGDTAVDPSTYTVTAGNDTATIVAVQEALNAAGYDCGAADGYLGGNTASAIERYQKDHGLKETGMIDADLLESLKIARENG